MWTCSTLTQVSYQTHNGSPSAKSRTGITAHHLIVVMQGQMESSACWIVRWVLHTLHMCESLHLFKRATAWSGWSSAVMVDVVIVWYLMHVLMLCQGKKCAKKPEMQQECHTGYVLLAHRAWVIAVFGTGRVLFPCPQWRLSWQAWEDRLSRQLLLPIACGLTCLCYHVSAL